MAACQKTNILNGSPLGKYSIQSIKCSPTNIPHILWLRGPNSRTVSSLCYWNPYLQHIHVVNMNPYSQSMESYFPSNTPHIFWLRGLGPRWTYTYSLLLKHQVITYIAWYIPALGLSSILYLTFCACYVRHSPTKLDPLKLVPINFTSLNYFRRAIST